MNNLIFVYGCISLMISHNLVFGTEDLTVVNDFEKQNENEQFIIETSQDPGSISETKEDKDKVQNVDAPESIENDNLDLVNSEGDSSTETLTVAADDNSTANGTTEGNSTKVNCVLRILPEGEVPQVRVMNLSALSIALTPVPNITDGECAVVLFYSPWCVFSARAAPHFNALARVFPHISFYAIDAVQHTTLHMRYGLIAVPTILFFQNGRAVAKFNGSHANLERFANFVNGFTGIAPDGALNVTSADMTGPVPAALQERIDYILLLSWTFTIICMCIWFLKSSFCHRIVESIQNTWREAEAQHEHED